MAIVTIITVPREQPKRGAYIRRTLKYDDSKTYPDGTFQVIECYWEQSGFNNHDIRVIADKPSGQVSVTERGKDRINIDPSELRVAIVQSRLDPRETTWKLPESPRVSAKRVKPIGRSIKR